MADKYQEFRDSLCACSSDRCKRKIREEMHRWQGKRGALLPREAKELKARKKDVGICTIETVVKPRSRHVRRGGMGIRECDEYIDNYTRCITTKIPAAARKQMLDAFSQIKGAWVKAAETQEGRKALAIACGQAQEAAKTAMEAFGCEWSM